MELTLVVVGGYMALVILVGLVRGWNGGTGAVHTRPAVRRPVRSVVPVRNWLGVKTGFKVVVN